MALPIQIVPHLVVNLEYVVDVECVAAINPLEQYVRLRLVGEVAPRDIPWTAGGERLWKLYTRLASRQLDHIRYTGLLTGISDAVQAACV